MKIRTFPLKGLINGQFTKESKVPAVSSWKTHGGGHDNAQVYGVAIPEGFIVIDIDSHKDTSINYLYELEKLANESIRWNDAWIQNTVSGGEHYLFRVPRDLNITARQLMVNVDTRVGGKSYIATGFGYTTKGDVIENKFTDDKPMLPKKLLDLLTSQSPLYDVAMKGVPDSTPISYIEASKWIYRVNPKLLNNYDEWINFTLAVKRLYLNNPKDGEGIKELWDEVCSQADNYDQADNFKRFQQVDPTLANIETIKRLAFKDPSYWIEEELKLGTTIKSIREDILTSRIRKQRKYEIINKFNLIDKEFKNESKSDLIKEESPKIVRFDNKYVGDSHLYTQEYINFVFSKYEISESDREKILGFAYDVTAPSRQCYYHFGSDTYLMRKAVNFCLSRVMICDKETGESVPPLTVFDQVVQLIFGVTYHPNEGKFYIKKVRGEEQVFANTYNSVPHKKKEVDVNDPVIERHNRHLSILFPNKVEREPFQYHLARIIQRKNATGMAVLIQGAQGCGKTYFKGFFEAVLGYDNVKAVDYRKVLEGSFDDWKTGSIVNCLEEVKPEGKYTSYFAERLKEAITANLFSVERKYKPTVTMQNFTNYFAFTNHIDAVALEQFDRRWFVMQCAQQSKADVQKIYDQYGKNYFELLFDDLKNSAEVLYNYYMDMTLPIEEAKRREAPMSAAKELLIENNRSNDDIEIEDYLLESLYSGAYLDFFLNKTTLDLYTMRLRYNRYATENGYKLLTIKRLKFILGRLGWRYYGSFKDDVRRFILYYKPEFYIHWIKDFKYAPVISEGKYWDTDILGPYGTNDKRMGKLD